MSPLPDCLAEVRALEGLDRAVLAERWALAFGCPAPRRCESTLLRGALAWHVQMQALRQSVGRRAADRMLQPAQGSAAVLAPGTRLVREWQGRAHRVTVLESGFEYEKQTYRSLTAVARRITGTAWSGPLFFGIK